MTRPSDMKRRHNCRTKNSGNGYVTAGITSVDCWPDIIYVTEGQSSRTVSLVIYKRHLILLQTTDLIIRIYSALQISESNASRQLSSHSWRSNNRTGYALSKTRIAQGRQDCRVHRVRSTAESISGRRTSVVFGLKRKSYGIWEREVTLHFRRCLAFHELSNYELLGILTLQ
jgi:hypothetical protein